MFVLFSWNNWNQISDRYSRVLRAAGGVDIIGLEIIVSVAFSQLNDIK